MRLFRPTLACLALLATGLAPPPGKHAATIPRAGIVRVRLVTSAGPIVVALDTRAAPATTANFLAYVDDGRFDGTTFYRAARRASQPTVGFVQGGIRTDARRILPPFPLEPTSRTGLHHLDGTISMARAATPDSAGGNFFITVGPAPQMDARGAYPGYAAFGHVVEGMATVRQILASPSGGGLDAFKGQMILRPVRLVSARRLDGAPRPTRYPRPWLLGKR